MVRVVGIGADGWGGLTSSAQAALADCEVLLGSGRQLDLLPQELAAERVSWPSPLPPAVPRLLAEHAGRRIGVLASGDPMHYGIGRLLVRHLGADRLEMHSHPSSITLACARLGWPVEDVEVVSAVGRDPRRLAAVLHPDVRIVVLSADATTPAAVAGLLRDRGYGASTLTVLADLGAPNESRFEGGAADWDGQTQVPALNVVAVHVQADPAPGAPAEAPARPHLVPGLPDEAYDTDGQLTKWEVRALTLAALAPAPGQLLWDIGGGTGTIGVEWMRAHRSCRAIALERRRDRAARIARNAGQLGVPGLRVVLGAAPQALATLREAADADRPDADRPDAVFIGGGLGTPGVVDACWAALRPGGRLVANTVTLESEALLVQLQARLGGRLVRLEVARAEAIGGFTGWVPARPVTQWSAIKPHRHEDWTDETPEGEDAL
nr:precorrin-6y C5,15-methyltransferase (decarboxylating) subunit CbiE [Kineosphaera limosa]